MKTLRCERLHSPRRLDITITPAKSHNGKYGTGVTIVKINPAEAGAAASYLAARCGTGVMVVSLDAKEKSRKRLLRLGKTALPGCDVNITPYVFRNQVIADFKATVGAGAGVAAACGHSTERTQARYGYVQHGRRRRGLIGVASQIAPRTGNITRTRNLGKKSPSASGDQADALGSGIMDACRPQCLPRPVARSLHLAPGAMRVEEDEQVCGARHSRLL